MKQSLNSLNGRLNAIKLAQRKKYLADRSWRSESLDHVTETCDPLCPICSNAP